RGSRYRPEDRSQRGHGEETEECDDATTRSLQASTNDTGQHQRALLLTVWFEPRDLMTPRRSAERVGRTLGGLRFCRRPDRSSMSWPTSLPGEEPAVLLGPHVGGRGARRLAGSGPEAEALLGGRPRGRGDPLGEVAAEAVGGVVDVQ